MFGFGADKNTFLGIDIGTSAIKMAEVKVDGGKPVLSNYAWMPHGMFDKSDINADSFVAFFSGCVKKMMKEAGFKARNAYIAIPAFSGLITIIDFPQMPAEDMDQAVRFEAQKYIPTSLDEVVLSWEIVSSGSAGSEEGNGGKIQILLVAASKKRVEKYEDVVKASGLNLAGVEIESFSMVNSLVGNDPGRFVIVDIGSRICNIVLVESQSVKANRNIDAGGKDITKTIAKSLQIDEERAEKMKTAKKDFFTEKMRINFPTLEMIVSEASRMIRAYREKEGSGEIDAIILSGGTAKLQGLDAYFQKALGVKTIVGNSMARLQYDNKLEPKIREINTHFSVCAGLALKGAGKK